MFHAFVNATLAFSQHLGYGGIVFLMAIESSFLPFPSELVIPPAAYLAQKGEFNIFLVIIAGVCGSLLGSIFNYFLALTLGRRIIYKIANHKLARFILLTPQKLKKAEIMFRQYGNISTFIGRLIPAIRQLVSLPAGFARMNFKNFIFFTTLGSGVWTIILASLGYFFGAQEKILLKYYKEISFLLAIIGVIFLVFIFTKNNGRKKI